MKKNRFVILAMIFVVALSFSLMACDEKSEDNAVVLNQDMTTEELTKIINECTSFTVVSKDNLVGKYTERGVSMIYEYFVAKSEEERSLMLKRIIFWESNREYTIDIYYYADNNEVSDSFIEIVEMTKEDFDNSSLSLQLMKQQAVTMCETYDWHIENNQVVMEVEGLKIVLKDFNQTSLDIPEKYKNYKDLPLTEQQ